MDGYSNNDRTAAPTGFMEALRERNPVALALHTWRDRETLRPVNVPTVPTVGFALDALLSAHTPGIVPEDLREEHREHCNAVEARAGALAENRRRLRSSLWCEQCLRAAGRLEHRVMRAFNIEAWGVQEAAPHDFSLRELQVGKYA